MKQLSLTAPCKINLALDICGRRPDGYHEMDMVLQSISLGDRLSISRREEPGLSLCCDDPSLPCDERNLVLRCAKAFFEYTGLVPAADFMLEKRVPMMAGLGGGSADGAAALCGLNRLFETNLSAEELCRLSFPLGADIPFCIVGGTQQAQGAGEVLSPAPPLPDCWIVVVKPPFSVSTRLAFEGFDRQEQPPRVSVEKLLGALEGRDLRQIGAALGNVFEPFCQPQQLAPFRETLLRHGAAGALLSGSGSALFGLFEEEAAAKTALEALRPLAQQVDLARPFPKGIYQLAEE